MSYSFKNRSLVEVDIIVALEYYKEINPLLAKAFLLQIREAKKHITQSPFGFQVKYNGVRTISLKQFPYLIHYLIDEDENQIVILAIIHSHKDFRDYSSR